MLHITVRADYRHTPGILEMPPMCQAPVAVQYLKNTEIMMKTGLRLPCGKEYQMLHLQYFLYLVYLLRWEKFFVGSAGIDCFIVSWLIAWMVNLGKS